MSDAVERVTEALLAVPGVVALAADPDAESSTVGGVIDPDGESTAVHVLVDADASIPATAHEVRRVAHDITGRCVDVTVEEIR